MKETKQLATLLHTLLCDKKHAVEMSDLDDKTKCCFYVEQSIDEAWELPDHLAWYDEARRFIAIAEPHGVEQVIKHLIAVYQILLGFRQADPRLGEFVVRLLKTLTKDI